MARVFIALGSNLDDRLANLAQARQLLDGETHIFLASSIYETPPWGYTEQPAFYNQALAVKTDLTPLRLLNKLKRIEKIMGREETFRYGPRVIDLDILFYDDRILNTKRLQIPHPRLQERAFVLVLLAEIIPDLIHPVLDKTVSELLRGVDTTGVRKL